MRNLTLLIAALTLLSISSANAQPTSEQRIKMAEMHEKMANCLRSDKDIAVCKDEMHKACEESGEVCPMGEMRHKKMMHKMDKMPKSSTTPSDKE